MKFSLIIIISLIFIFSNNKSLAQCCAAGNPVSSNSSITDFGKNTLGVTYSYIYSNSNTYYSGTRKVDKKYNETEFNFSNLALFYGVTNRLKVLIDIGYFFNKSQNFVNLDYKRYAKGFGDLNIGFSYDTYQSENNEFNISQSARLTIPVGIFNQVYDGIELPIDLQPSSGNYKYNLGLMISKRFGNSGFTLYSINSFEISQFIETNTSKYKYGNLYNLSLLGSYQILDELSGRLQMRAEIRDKALSGNKNIDNQYSFINATGGLIAFVSPQFNYTFLKKWTFSLQCNYPLYKDVNGEQLTNQFSVQAGISSFFNFVSAENPLDYDNDNPKHSELNLKTCKFTVFGSCDMCKSRIEDFVNEQKDVSDSEWDLETNILTIFYENTKPDIVNIMKSLASIGHDNEQFKAIDSVFNNLPKCCLYRSK